MGYKDQGMGDKFVAFQSILMICRFCICEVTFSLKHIYNPQFSACAAVADIYSLKRSLSSHSTNKGPFPSLLSATGFCVFVLFMGYFVI